MKTNLNEYESRLFQERGLYATIAPIMSPFLQKMREEIIAGLITDFKTGKTDFLAKIAQLTTITDMKEELRIKETQIKILEEKVRS